jgi:hypothetical protein
MNRNEEVLYDFKKYCEEHPEERFWQALRNWSNYEFIYVSNKPSYAITCEEVQDTFFFEGKDK